MKKIWGEPRVFKGLAVQHHCSPDEPVLAHALSTLTDAKNSRGRASAMLELLAFLAACFRVDELGERPYWNGIPNDLL